MNCQEFWDHLSLHGHEITETQASHLAACAACAAQWKQHGDLADWLRSCGEEWRQVEAPTRVETGLMAAYRAQAGPGVRPSFSRPPNSRPSYSKPLYSKQWWTPVFAWASAAAATVALAAVLSRGYQPEPVRPGTVAAPSHTTQPKVQVATVAFQADSEDDSAVYGEGFVRLPNAPRSEPNEDFNVVRVEVPGSAMIAAGISLGEDRARETVLADVALASDGTPRAVRLVSDGGAY
jgi:hypothetical protein